MKRTRSTSLRRWGVFLALPVLLFLAMNWLIRQMVYPAPPLGVPAAPPGLEDVYIPFSGEAKAHGWLFHAPAAADSTPVMLFFHGNGENLGALRLSGILADFQELSVSFLALDYPGYGRSGGTPSEAALLAAADSAFIWIKENFAGSPKTICGWSLGAAVAIQTAAKHSRELAGLIALSPWASLPEVAAVHYPRWLANSLLDENYNSLEAASRVRCPALVIHGEQDAIIPAAQGEKVAANMGGEFRWVKVPQAGHNDLFSRQAVWEEIRSFLKALRESAPSKTPK